MHRWVFLLLIFLLAVPASATPIMITLDTVPKKAEIYLVTSSSTGKGLYLGKSGEPIPIEESFLKGRSSLDLRVEKNGFHPVVHNLKVLAITNGATLPNSGPLRLPGDHSGFSVLVTIASLAMLLGVALTKRKVKDESLGFVDPSWDGESHSLDPMIGRSICGFRLEKAVDRGGMGVVYQAKQSGNDNKAAIKILDLSGHHESHRDRFFRELAVASKLHHPAIVQTWDYDFLEDRFLAIVMEFLEGAPMNRVVLRGSKNPAEMLDLLEPIFGGLQYLHDKGITHRDIKPQNIFVQPDNTCKLIDFGLARDEHQDSLTRTGMLVGTPKYMAPEQITDKGSLSPLADQYALGLIIFEFVTGRAPYLVEDARALLMEHLCKDPSLAHEVNNEVPQPFSEALARMYKRTPEERYPSITEAYHALRKSL